MLKRKIEQVLMDWKNNPNRKPLIIKGCRQCGKTFSVRDFAYKNYNHVVYLNFYENSDYMSIFEGSLETDNIIMMLSALMGKEAVFVPGETILRNRRFNQRFLNFAQEGDTRYYELYSTNFGGDLWC